jgi:hypothetical protein
MAIEKSTASWPNFPHEIKGGRPDVRISLGSGYEALIDITSYKEAFKMHTKNREWGELNDHVLFVGEMPYGEPD